MDENNQQSDKELLQNDPYGKRMPEVLREMWKEQKQIVTEKEWLCPAAMTVVPIAGILYFYRVKKNKDGNLNERNYAHAGMTVNGCMTVILALIIGIAVFFSKGSTGTKNILPIESSAYTSETMETFSDSESITYNSNAEALYCEVNGETVTFPTTVNDWKNHSWESIGNIVNPNDGSQTIASLYDNAGSAAMLYYKTADGPGGECIKTEVTFNGAETSFMGLNGEADYDYVKQTLKGYESVNEKDFNSFSKTGIVQYVYGRYVISVSIKKDTVTSVTVEMKE